MRLIIDIPEEGFNACKLWVKNKVATWQDVIIAKGTPYEERLRGEWIPVSERLPEQYSVLCCDKYGEIMVAHPFEDEGSDNGFSAESEECYMFNCVAWMPLPEPYKEADDETDN